MGFRIWRQKEVMEMNFEKVRKLERLEDFEDIEDIEELKILHAFQDYGI